MPNMSSESRAKLHTILERMAPEETLQPTVEELREQIATTLPNYYLLSRDTGLTEALTQERAIREQFMRDFHAHFADSDALDEYLSSTPSLDSSPALEQVRHCQSLLEPLVEEVEVPAVTLCVPLAIRTESNGTIQRMMEQVSKAAEATQGPVRIIVWANAKYKPQEQSEVESQASERYTQLRDLLSKFSSDKVQITTALETIPTEDFSMSKLRSHYMDALVGETIDGKLSFEHPVVWLDADTTYLSANALQAIQSDLTDEPLGFCHPDVDYSLEWTEGTPARDFDDASKVLLIDEMARRASKRTAILNQQRIKERLYAEESGIGFTMATYMMAGGVDIDDPINETVRLTKRYKQFLFNPAVADITTLHSHIESVYFGSPAGRLMKHTDQLPTTREMHWLNNAKIRLSGRRLYEGIKSHGVESLTLRTSGLDGDYTLFSDIADHSGSTAIDPTAAEKVLLRDRDKAGNAVGRKVVRHMLKNKNLDLTK